MLISPVLYSYFILYVKKILLVNGREILEQDTT